MITLSATNMSLEVVLGAAVTTSAWEVVVAYVDHTTTSYTPAGSTTTVNSTVAVTAVAAPAASTQRQVKYLSIFNADTVSGTVTVRISTGGTLRRTRVCTLATLESLVWDGVTWKTYSATGAEKVDNSATIPSENVIAPGSQRVLMSTLPTVAGAVVTSGTAYWSYVGQVATSITVKHVEFVVSVAGAGAQVAEACLASTPAAPNKADKSLTKLVASGTVDALTATGVRRNTTNFNTLVAAGTHLWAGLRIAMATTQPQIIGIGGDFNQGQYLTTAASGVLTGAGPFTGTRVAADLALTWRAPDLRVVLD